MSPRKQRHVSGLQVSQEAREPARSSLSALKLRVYRITALGVQGRIGRGAVREIPFDWLLGLSFVII